jgi:hypothetical protein
MTITISDYWLGFGSGVLVMLGLLVLWSLWLNRKAKGNG